MNPRTLIEYGGELRQLGAIVRDLRAIAASRFPDDEARQERMVGMYLAGLLR